MTPRLFVALAAAGVGAIGISLTTLPACAQSMPLKPELVAAKAQGAMPNAPRPRRPVWSKEDRAAFLDAHIAALHAGLALSADQEKLWPPVEQALRAFGQLCMTRREAFLKMPHPMDVLERLKLRSANMVARGEALKKLADAAAPLYAKLTDAQKHRLPVLLRAMHRPMWGRGRFMMMHRGPGMFMGPRFMHPGMGDGGMGDGGMGFGGMGFGGMGR